VEVGLSKYAALRARYTPEHPTIIFVLESPPVSGKYFYDPDGFTTEPLFSGMMKDVLELSPKTKDAGLTQFAARNYLLLDATYTPVNISGKQSARKKAAAAQITKDFSLLVAELRKHTHPDTQLVLVMANVRKLLDQRLKTEGFTILNDKLLQVPRHRITTRRLTHGVIPFPGNGWPIEFRTTVRHVLGLQPIH
jgi:hypothetical protein